MRRIALLGLASLAALTTASVVAEAQTRNRPLVLRVQPRSFLDPGPVVPVGSINPGYTGYGQAQSYLLSPPYAPNGAGFGVATLLTLVESSAS